MSHRRYCQNCKRSVVSVLKNNRLSTGTGCIALLFPPLLLVMMLFAAVGGMKSYVCPRCETEV